MKVIKYTVILISHPNPDCNMPCICYKGRSPFLVDTQLEASIYAEQYKDWYKGIYRVAEVIYDIPE